MSRRWLLLWMEGCTGIVARLHCRPMSRDELRVYLRDNGRLECL